jgi:hypothetical protein
LAVGVELVTQIPREMLDILEDQQEEMVEKEVFVEHIHQLKEMTEEDRSGIVEGVVEAQEELDRPPQVGLKQETGELGLRGTSLKRVLMCITVAEVAEEQDRLTQ